MEWNINQVLKKGSPAIMTIFMDLEGILLNEISPRRQILYYLTLC